MQQGALNKQSWIHWMQLVEKCRDAKTSKLIFFSNFGQKSCRVSSNWPPLTPCLHCNLLSDEPCIWWLPVHDTGSVPTHNGRTCRMPRPATQLINIIILASHVTAVLLDAYLTHGGLAGGVPVVGQVKGAIHFAWQGTSMFFAHYVSKRYPTIMVRCWVDLVKLSN